MPTTHFIGILGVDWHLAWEAALRGYREFEQRIDSLADGREPKGMAVPRAEKRQLVREVCQRQLVPFPVSGTSRSALALAVNSSARCCGSWPRRA